MGETNTQTNGGDPEKTFSQAQVDAIVGDRLAREREKYADYADLQKKAKAYDEYSEKNKTDLQKANDKAAALEAELNKLKDAEKVRSIREKVAKELSVPAELLSGSDEESCKKQAQAILDFAKPKGYPGIKGKKSAVNGSGSSRTDGSDDGEVFREFANQIFGGKE